MVYKTWNVRDQPKETLERQLEKINKLNNIKPTRGGIRL